MAAKKKVVKKTVEEHEHIIILSHDVHSDTSIVVLHCKNCNDNVALAKVNGVIGVSRIEVDTSKIVVSNSEH